MRLRNKLGAIALTMCSSAFAQQFVDADHIDKAKRAFNALVAAPTLQCEIKPVQPALDFSMRLETGYKIDVPLNQFLGPGHGWSTLLRVTPSTGKPVYLGNTSKLPDVPSTKADGEVSGGFVVGEGIYEVTVLVEDDQKRTCHNAWHIDAKLGRVEQGLQPAMPPNTVGEISGPVPMAQRAGNPKISRLTILVHAAARSTQVSILQDDDTLMLVGMLSALMEQLPAREVRLVVFNLEQQRVVLRSDNFVSGEIEGVSKAINELQLASVDYGMLSNPKGTVDLLTGLVDTELRREKPSDAVIFLGPHARIHDPVPALSVEASRQAVTRFCYLEYERRSRPQTPTEISRKAVWSLGEEGRPRDPAGIPWAPSALQVEDSIEQLMSRLKGQTVIVGRPQEFASALNRLSQRGGRH